MIKQTSISYYGLNYVEHAEADFAEMKAHGVTCVILAVTEFDFDFWRPNIPKIVEKAHEMGLKCVIDPWGNGKYFGGEQVSKFLQDNVENRQVSALTGSPPLPARSCPTPASTRTPTATTSATSAPRSRARRRATDSSGTNRTMPSRRASPPSPAAWRTTGRASVPSAASASSTTTATRCRAT